MRRLTLVFCILFAFFSSRAQEGEILVSLDERFFNLLLDSVFKEELEFSIAEFREEGFIKASFDCKETVKLRKRIGDRQSEIQFREKRILALIAFTGSYNFPFLGCLDFSGVAESLINLEYGAEKRSIFARVKVLSVNLSGTGGIGGSLIAKMVQGTVDRKINPIEVINLDRLSFNFSVKERQVQMKALAIRYEVMEDRMNIFIRYVFD
ncbi:MAG: hypothetical protein N2Z23_09610 [Pyrinomonadaceae bacterium]|nr:hypothetical protein [Pyrinomonadaceae bacterium]MCX7640678.1 hypothetical protein [Pyrinomonadaceae bacterium]MDW8305362.1 hypothetical protein [Acidobacteriota bacterium]